MASTTLTKEKAYCPFCKKIPETGDATIMFEYRTASRWQDAEEVLLATPASNKMKGVAHLRCWIEHLKDLDCEKDS